MSLNNPYRGRHASEMQKAVKETTLNAKTGVFASTENMNFPDTTSATKSVQIMEGSTLIVLDPHEGTESRIFDPETDTILNLSLYDSTNYEQYQPGGTFDLSCFGKRIEIESVTYNAPHTDIVVRGHGLPLPAVAEGGGKIVMAKSNDAYGQISFSVVVDENTLRVVDSDVTGQFDLATDKMYCLSCVVWNGASIGSDPQTRMVATVLLSNENTQNFNLA